ncbi:hypothetical protein FJ366_03840 [Candidatus Dependentiae bacterium]|nr:hypothetical protein [Candidatus Dependentiae bacterium]
MIHNFHKKALSVLLLSAILIPVEIFSMFRMCSGGDIQATVYVPRPQGTTSVNVTTHHHAAGDRAPRASARASAKVSPLDFEFLTTPITSPRGLAGAGRAGGAHASPRGRTTQRAPVAPRGSPRHHVRVSPVIHSPRTRDVRHSLRGPQQRVRFDDTIIELDGDFQSPTTAAARRARERRHTIAEQRPPRAPASGFSVGSALTITDIDSIVSPEKYPGRVVSPEFSPSDRRSIHRVSRHDQAREEADTYSDRELFALSKKTTVSRLRDNTQLLAFVNEEIILCDEILATESGTLRSVHARSDKQQLEQIIKPLRDAKITFTQAKKYLGDYYYAELMMASHQRQNLSLAQMLNLARY